ncbi:MAG: 50S ribosomal protein L18 [Verrucomicrobia bacterium]|nr:50S ribosomal protein L18 [Verrucomicrobiota bacterium]
MASTKNISPLKMRHIRLRKRIAGTATRPRLSVHFSGNHIYAQVIDDDRGITIAGVCTTEKTFSGGGRVAANVETAVRVGKEVANRAIAHNVTKVVFDRGGFLYHGKVKALADAAREAGLNF